MLDQDFLAAAFEAIMEEDESSADAMMEISIRQVNNEDHTNIVKLFQTFDKEKYKHLSLPEPHNNNEVRRKEREALLLPGLRIDERGGIYLNPLLDSNNAYFKCYVAQDVNSTELIGYILFFNTLDERAGQVGVGSATDDPVVVIEDLYVRPAYRGRGIGTQLFRRVLKSSLDRGCFSCECLLIPESKEGVTFWKRRVGSSRIETLIQEQRAESQQSEHHELVVELSRMEMKAFYERTALPTSSEKENGY